MITERQAHIELDGRPVPWARMSGKSGRRFVPAKQRKHKAWIQSLLGGHLLASHLSVPLFPKGPVELILTFSMPVKDDRLWGQLHWKKPDSDNLEKQILDACNSLLWTDDAQVARVRKEKRYAEHGLTQLIVREAR